MATIATGANSAGLPRKQKSEQRPFTYLRQLMALMLDPQLLAGDGYGCYPADVVARARRLLAQFPGSSVGSYTHTGGHLPIREACAQFLSLRDGGLPCRVEDVQVTCGSVEAIRLLLEGFGRRAPTPAAALVPAPGCRLYAEFARQVGVRPAPYRLGGPELGWQLVEAELELAYQSALESGSEPRVLVLINPGSPAGQLLSRTSLQLAADFARRRRLLVIADETLQFATFDCDGARREFVGFRRVALDDAGGSGGPSPPLEVASLASLSAGHGGEAGLRVGFCELLNLHPAARAGLVTVLACTSCPPVLGQAALAAALTPPEPGEASHAGYAAEVADAAAGLRRRAAMVAAAFPGDDDGTAPRAGGFAYPRLALPKGGLISIANEPADAAFCRELRQLAPGLAAQPGSAFGQQPDGEAFHVRISIQSSDDDLMADLNLMKELHLDFLQRHGN